MEIGTKYTVLSIDQEKEVQYFLKKIFLRNGYKFYTAGSGSEGMSMLANSCPDLVLLDLVLPDMDGIEAIKHVRQFSDCPVVVVTSKGKEMDKVLALDAGADDYITKPFGTEELMARIRCMLRRRCGKSGANIYQAEDLKIDFEKRIVFVNGGKIHLTPVEYRIVEYLAMHSGKMIPYQMLLEKIWGPYAGGNNKILRVNMTNIRRKIGDNPAEPKYIFTEAGAGYRMVESSV